MNVSRLMRGISAVVLSVGLVAASVGNASAEGFAISTLSARGGAFGGGAAAGMVGRADDASAAIYNPAGLTQLPGTQVMAGLAAVALNLDVESYDTGHWMSNSHQVWPIPNAYLSHQINDKFWFGIGMATRWGLGHSYPDNWAAHAIDPAKGVYGTNALKSITLLTSTINPSIAYKLNDVWSLSAGVSYTWGYLSLNQQLDVSGVLHPAAAVNPAMAALRDSADVRIHSENGRSFGYNLGVHAKFNEQWSAGLTYRSHERMKFNGSARVRGYGQLNGQLASTIAAMGGIGNTRGKATLVLPDVITFGVAYKPCDRLSFEADAAYTVWSRWRALDVDLYGYSGIHQQKNWRDTWSFSFSAEYWMYDWLALRAGVMYETSPLNGEMYHDYFIPTNGRLQASVGFGLKYEAWTLDFAYIHMHERETPLADHQNNGIYSSFNGKFGNGYDHTFALSLGYKF